MLYELDDYPEGKGDRVGGLEKGQRGSLASRGLARRRIEGHGQEWVHYSPIYSSGHSSQDASFCIAYF